MARKLNPDEISYRDYCEKLSKLQGEINDRTQKSLGRDAIFIQPISPDGEPLRMGVTWASVGATDPKRARDFISALIMATQMAETTKLNGKRIVYGQE